MRVVENSMSEWYSCNRAIVAGLCLFPNKCKHERIHDDRIVTDDPSKSCIHVAQHHWNSSRRCIPPQVNARAQSVVASGKLTAYAGPVKLYRPKRKRMLSFVRTGTLLPACHRLFCTKGSVSQSDKQRHGGYVTYNNDFRAFCNTPRRT